MQILASLVLNKLYFNYKYRLYVNNMNEMLKTLLSCNECRKKMYNPFHPILSLSAAKSIEYIFYGLFS